MVEIVSLDLRACAKLLRSHAKHETMLSPGACRRLAGLLSKAARRADELEARAREAEELDDELHAMAQDLAGIGETGSRSYQAALKDQQRVIQARLDGDPGPVRVPRRAGIASLATPIGDSNVVTFPLGSGEPA
ncbi:hypothetical protein [Bosea sp. BK604]|uniref:hypothetical protein n=1 Tax=Bosea sp. BK604 TaxID=2512180 RepID=UPI0010486C0F|nr:hypothetical protein [Bosea sp. BK604]TCR70496.1 hypothetical protein EV560_101903 [Bosea sp. BK604]